MKKLWMESFWFQLGCNVLVFALAGTLIVLKVNAQVSSKADIIYVDDKDRTIIEVMVKENKITRDSISECNKLLRGIYNDKRGN